MKTKTSSIILVIIATVFAAIAQVLYKIGAALLKPSFYSVITNYYVLGGLCLYGISALLLIIALKNGELSVLYPIISLGYVWVALLAVWKLGESMSALKWLGVAVIIAGVSAIGKGSQYNETKRRTKKQTTKQKHQETNKKMTNENKKYKRKKK